MATGARESPLHRGNAGILRRRLRMKAKEKNQRSYEPTMSTPPKRSALGKGLESLLPSRPAAPAPVAAAPVVVNPPAPSGKPLEIDVELIDRNPYQTRTNFDEE